jgi:hypothetical protein
MHSRCINRTDEDLAVYGDAPAGSKMETALYRLPRDRATPDDWDCDGLFVPNDRVANQAIGADIPGPVAVKYMDFVNFTIRKSENKYDLPINQGTFRPDDICCPSRYPKCVCWPIPNESALWVASLPEVPGHIPAKSR